MISQTTNLGATLTSGKQVVIFKNTVGFGDLIRYNVYNTKTGSISFPHAMRVVNIAVNIVDVGLDVAGDIILEKNGVIVCIAQKNGGFATLNYSDVNVLSTDTYVLYFNKVSSVVLESGVLSNISIYAEV